MTIGQVAAQAGLAPSAIRYYEQQGLLAAPPRRGGRRVYSPEVLQQLVIIQFAREIGFTLAEVRLFLHGFPTSTRISTRWKKMAAGKVQEMDALIARAQAMKKMLEAIMHCRCRTLEQCAAGLARRPGRGAARADSFGCADACAPAAPERARHRSRSLR